MKTESWDFYSTWQWFCRCNVRNGKKAASVAKDCLQLREDPPFRLGLTRCLCSCVSPEMFLHVISITSPRASLLWLPWLPALGNSCYLWLSLECILPFGKIILGTPIGASRPESHHSQKKKKKKSALDPNCVGLQCQVPLWVHQPPSKETHTQDGAFALSPQEPGPLRERSCLGVVSCLLHAALVSSCPGRKVNCGVIPRIWEGHLLTGSEEKESAPLRGK